MTTTKVPTAQVSASVSAEMHSGFEGNPKCRWIIVDVRSAQSGVCSGISRFVYGMTKGLAVVLNSQKKVAWRLLLVGKQHPPQWVVDTVLAHPRVVTHWSGGLGALTSRFDQPTWLWPTLVLPEVMKVTGRNFVWIAPGNFDRPLLWSLWARRPGATGLGLRAKIVQVVHDVIPITQKASMGWLFRAQFGLLVRRTLGFFPGVVTVSRHSAQHLKHLVPKRGHDISVVGNGVDPVFGSLLKLEGEPRVAARVAYLQGFVNSMPRVNSAAKSAGSEQSRFLKLVRSSLVSDEQLPQMLHKLCTKRWALSIGRYQKYKGWELAQAAVAKVNSAGGPGCVLLRVGYSYDEFLRGHKGKYAGSVFVGQNFVYLEEDGVLGVFDMAEVLLPQLYNLSDCLLHPSLAEGFGLPPLEAALSGTPVLFSSGTAVEEHFKGSSLPLGFLQSLESRQPSDWANSMTNLFRGVDGGLPGAELLRELMNEMKVVAPRRVLEKYWETKCFVWEHCACDLLRELNRHFQLYGESNGACDVLGESGGVSQ